MMERGGMLEFFEGVWCGHGMARHVLHLFLPLRHEHGPGLSSYLLYYCDVEIWRKAEDTHMELFAKILCSFL